MSVPLYCNVLPLTVYFIGKLMYWQNLPLFDTWINTANGQPGTYSVFRHGRIRHLPPPCRLGGVPVHHDPMHGICTNPGNREWVRYAVPIVIFCGLCISHAQGLGELGPPHFPGCRPAWYNPKLYYLYIYYYDSLLRGRGQLRRISRTRCFMYNKIEVKYRRDLNCRKYVCMIR